MNQPVHNQWLFFQGFALVEIIANKKRRHHLHVELTPAQYRLLTEQANACGLSKRAYLVRVVEGTPIQAKLSQATKDLRWEVHKIGVNINQITRSVNAGIAGAEDARRGLFLLDQAYELMYEVAKKEALASDGQMGYNGQKVQGG